MKIWIHFFKEKKKERRENCEAQIEKISNRYIYI